MIGTLRSARMIASAVRPFTMLLLPSLVLAE